MYLLLQSPRNALDPLKSKPIFETPLFTVAMNGNEFTLSEMCLSHVPTTGNLRLQEMMGVMCKERGAKLFATDER